jgi:G3E family GTPase
VRLLCIGGFLGSGKTTILLQLARSLAASGKSVAIVENEIGEIGVDGEIVAALGLPVRELFGGCVCCTLQVGLTEALRDLSERLAPDWVIVEPTGLASQGDLVDVVRSWSPEIDDVLVLTVVDSARFAVLAEVAAPLIEAQIKAADVIVVNKTDEVDGATLERVRSALTALHPTAPLIAASATSSDVAGPVLGALRVSL